MRLRILLTFLVVSLNLFAVPVTWLKNKPKLVLLVVIDQLRADYLMRYQDQFLPPEGSNQTLGRTLGGFRFLTERGAWFPHGYFNMLQNMTGPGHAVLLTGAYPHLTGIPTNEWYNDNTGQRVYCAEDPNFQWMGSSAKHVGTSPRNMFATTLGDEYKMIHPKSKVVSLSLKDRAAIFMGGQRPDATIWLDPDRFQWTSTAFFFHENKLPKWVEENNRALRAIKEETLPGGKSSLMPPGLPWQFFPRVRWADKSALATPAGLWLTERLAESAVKEYQLGQDAETDFLAISFSSHDYAGHTYGPDGPAMKEMSIADDRVLSGLFNFLQKTLPKGMRDVTVVLTADHGVAPNPETIKSVGIEAGRVDEKSLQENLNKKLSGKWGAGEWVSRIKEMNIYLNQKLILEKGTNVVEIENQIKTELSKTPGLAGSFSKSDYQLRRLPPGITERQILNSYVPGRSGDIVGILRPFFVTGDDTADHQTGYAYDRTIPIVFFGESIVPGVYATEAETVDIAPTLAFLTGAVPPSLSEGRVLSEILKK